MWWLWLLLALVAARLYGKLSCGRFHSAKIITGKVVVVTGASAGVGRQAALNFARRGAKVYLACRDDARGAAAEAAIRARTANRHVHYLQLELSSLASVRRFVAEFRRREVKLDVLVNNAGTAGYGRAVTADGLLAELQVNHFGPFLLTALLAPLLRRTDGARVVTVASAAHRHGAVDRRDLRRLNEPRGRRSWWGAWRVYSASKLCNVLFSHELARRLPGVAVNCLHPGHVRTSLYRNIGGVAEAVMNCVLGAFFKTAEEGSQTVVFLALADEAADVTGKYYVDCREAATSAAARDERLAKELWAYSERVVGLRPEERV